MRHSRWAGILFCALAFAVSAAGESRVVKDLPLDPGGLFTLESQEGSVTVTGSTHAGAHIVLTCDRGDLNSEFELSFTSGPGWASVKAGRKQWSLWSESVSLHFEVEVPEATRTQIRTGGGSLTLSGLRARADARTSGGPIDVTGLNGGLEAYTSGGPIRLREVTGDARVGTSGGPISVEELEGNLVAHTSGGGIEVKGVSGHVEAKTSGGSIRVTYSPGNRRGGNLETSGGHIDVAIDRSASLFVDAATSGGSVHSDLPVRSEGTAGNSRLRGSIGSGGEELRLHTSGGSIRIRAL